MNSHTATIVRNLEARLLAADLEKFPLEEIPLKMAEIVDQTDELSGLNFAQLQKDLLGPIPIHFPDAFNPYRFVLCTNALFYIETLIWFTDPTSIHSHPFHGLAHVLDGQSINVSFKFEKQGETNEMSWGELIPMGLEKIGPGSKFYFSSGRDFIHRVFHLSPRCATLRIGLRRGKVGAPQWNYLSPGLGLSSEFANHKDVSLKLQLASRLFQFFPSEFRDGMRGILESDMAAGGLWFLCGFQAKNPNYDVYGELIKDCKRFCEPLKQSIRLALSRCVGDSFFLGEKFASAEALLLTGLVELFGFGKETGEYLTQIVGRQGIHQWLKKSLTDIALANHLATPVAWHLLDRMNGFDRISKPNPTSVRSLGLEGRQSDLPRQKRTRG